LGGYAVVEQTSAPRSMTRADGLLVNLDPSSARFAEVRRDIAAAEQLYDWLEAAHPEWASTAAGSRIAVLSQRRDLDVERFARRGGPYCNQARNSVLAYERFVRKHERLVVGGSAYPPTADLVAWFALWSIDETRALKLRTQQIFGKIVWGDPDTPECV
jgi:hypothetical protein